MDSKRVHVRQLHYQNLKFPSKSCVCVCLCSAIGYWRTMVCVSRSKKGEIVWRGRLLLKLALLQSWDICHPSRAIGRFHLHTYTIYMHNHIHMLTNIHTIKGTSRRNIFLEFSELWTDKSDLKSHHISHNGKHCNQRALKMLTRTRLFILAQTKQHT